jgi:hypothetical protein
MNRRGRLAEESCSLVRGYHGEILLMNVKAVEFHNFPILWRKFLPTATRGLSGLNVDWIVIFSASIS